VLLVISLHIPFAAFIPL